MGAIILALAPLIIQIGGFLIETFVSGSANQSARKTALQGWVDAHKNDVTESVNEHQSVENQDAELDQMAAATDAAAKAPSTNS